ncbi:hypothetical protein QYE76_026174 [Lolium multiflorum]|uniref:Retrotransposon gag domain-containing protein n=1 Tax=Lolium multiflorum TaxID=4521 RepID=A0AAD8VUW4_LOLMU|nr:hypothetical protein QYE76_026174 [Lolium multiflorum]
MRRRVVVTLVTAILHGAQGDPHGYRAHTSEAHVAGTLEPGCNERGPAGTSGRNVGRRRDLEKRTWLAKSPLRPKPPGAQLCQLAELEKQAWLAKYAPGESSGFDTFSHHRGSDLYNSERSLGTISASDELRVRFFAQSLTGSAFGWYTSLPPNSIRTWKQLEEQFHIQYHSEASEAGIADLAQVRQKRGETVSEYIQRFRTVRNRCYSVHVSEKEAVELAVVGLSSSIKDVASQADYPSLAHMVQKLSAYEQRHPDVYQRTNSSVRWSWLRQTRMKVLREIKR